MAVGRLTTVTPSENLRSRLSAEDIVMSRCRDVVIIPLGTFRETLRLVRGNMRKSVLERHRRGLNRRGRSFAHLRLADFLLYSGIAYIIPRGG
jgi:hypothetical protein